MYVITAKRGGFCVYFVQSEGSHLRYTQLLKYAMPFSSYADADKVRAEGEEIEYRRASEPGSLGSKGAPPPPEGEYQGPRLRLCLR